MTAVSRLKQPNGHYSLFVRYWTQNGQRIDTPVDALVDTGASKCAIPTALNGRLFQFPLVGHDNNVTTASNPRGFDVVVIPKICLVAVNVASNQLQVTDTNLEELNVSAWLGDSFILGMNFLSKFDISMLQNGKITIGR